MAEDKIRLKIDGVEVEASRGQTVIEAARAVGISIPYLCWHPILKPYGACRMCVVEVKGGRGMPASCHTEVADGMDVVTDSPAIGEVRRDILALTLTSHPHGCLTCWRIDHCGPTDVCLRNVSVTDRCVVCPQNERCELQDV
ncbi:MAG: (2Fe-2S)-binding protein, partial [Chloroflexi bacterium]|nr:(2Fe-2S)-binding protein [Chloroflexota bacterium]